MTQCFFVLQLFDKHRVETSSFSSTVDLMALFLRSCYFSSRKYKELLTSVITYPLNSFYTNLFFLFRICWKEKFGILDFGEKEKNRKNVDCTTTMRAKETKLIKEQDLLKPSQLCFFFFSQPQQSQLLQLGERKAFTSTKIS